MHKPPTDDTSREKGISIHAFGQTWEDVKAMVVEALRMSNIDDPELRAFGNGACGDGPRYRGYQYDTFSHCRHPEWAQFEDDEIDCAAKQP